MNIVYKLRTLWSVLSRPFRRTYTANICGHKTKRKGIMHVFEHTTIMQMPLAENGNPDYCLECIGNMSIKCAWCGNPISIGSPITLYVPNEDYEVPDYAVRYTESGSKALVGCLGWDCADTGADMCGRWMPPGKVERMLSPIELAMGAATDGKPAMVMVGDTHDPSSVSVHPTH